MHRPVVALAALILVALAGCSSEDSASGMPGRDRETPSSSAGSATATATSSPVSPTDVFEDVVDVDGDRGLYVRCSGEGAPTVLMEGGDEDTSSSYAFAESRIAALTRTCVYDRANLGSSDPVEGPRQLTDLVADLEGLLAGAHIPGPYVIVATSGGGYISAGYAMKHRRQVASGDQPERRPRPVRQPGQRPVGHSAGRSALLAHR